MSEGAQPQAPGPKPKPENLSEIKPKAFQDPESGVIYEIYPIVEGKKITFNLDGVPFKFKNFLFITTRLEENALTGCFIHAPKVEAEGILKINETLEFPEPAEEGEPITKDMVMELGEVDIRFQIKEEAITKFINPKFANIKNVKQIFALRDDIGGSVILDFYYYTIIMLTPPFVEPPLSEEEMENAEAGVPV
jgi:hypothetical protein